MPALSKQTHIGVVGAGAMGAGIAQVAASYGHPVMLMDMHADALQRALQNLSRGLDKQISRGKLIQADADAIMARITPATSLEQLADAGLVIEAVVENIEVKQNIFVQLEKLCCSETVFASNTSSISITALGSTLQHPERLAGMHFFNPPQAMKLVEVIAGLATEEVVVETLLQTASAWGKTPVRTKSTPGFIVNRVARPFYAEALRLLQDGVAGCREIDAVITGSGGFRMGPFELMDLIGHDVNYAVTESVFAAYYQDPRYKPSIIQRELVSGGFLGRKSGRGFYDYNREPEPVTCQPPGEFSGALLVVGKPVGADMIATAAKAAGVVVEQQEPKRDGGYFSVANMRFAFTDGRTATEWAAAGQHHDWVLVDLVLDFAQCTHIALAAADGASAAARVAVGAFFQHLGKEVIEVDDSPAMVVMRTVCMLINEAADTVKEGVCNAADLDIAMRLGTNYPVGPLAWAEAIGLSRVQYCMEQLLHWYAEDRYRLSSLLRRLVMNGGRFHH